MACFNGAGFIKRSFESILAQTWPKIELVFVDDGSTDDSYDVTLGYQSRFDQRGYELKVIRQENAGFVNALYKAYTHTTGKYLQLLDVDDYIMPESTQLQAEFLDGHPDVDVVRTDGYMVPEGDLDNTTHRLRKGKAVEEYQDIFLDLVTGRENNWAGTYMVRLEPIKQFYAERPFYISKYGQNLQFLLPLTLNKQAGYIDRPLFKYVRVPGSLSNQSTYAKLRENIDGYWDIRHHMLMMLGVADNEVLMACETAYWNACLSLADSFNEAEEYWRAYDKLDQYGALTLQQRTDAAIRRGSLSQYPLRLLLKLKKLRQ